MDETYYDRRLAPEQQPPKKSRLLRLIGVEQYRSRKLRNTFAQAAMRPVKVLTKPTVFISCVYYVLTFAWVVGMSQGPLSEQSHPDINTCVGINTTLAIFVTPLYNFGPKQIGYFYFTPIIAALVGETIGHWLHDFIAKTYIKRHKGHFEPEVRLQAIWISTPFTVAGLVLIGFCLEDGYHYMITALAWGIYVFGTMVTTVAVTAYNLDSYPEGSGEVASLVNFARVLGGFIISYFQVKWAKSMGTKKSFGIQAAICVFAFLLIIGLQLFGKRLRIWGGKLHFHTV